PRRRKAIAAAPSPKQAFMATENKPNNNNANNKDKKRKRYLPYSKSVKKGSYPLRPGVQGFFITCDGGRERQASNEAINVLDTFYEQLVDGEASSIKHAVQPSKPLNKKITFSDSDSSSDDEESAQIKEEDANQEKETSEAGDTPSKKQCLETIAPKEEEANHEDQTSKKQCLEATEQKEEEANLEDQTSKLESVVNEEPVKKSIDKLIEEELKELKDRSKRRFVTLDPGCNGVAFVQMLKRDGDPGPADIVKHMMMSAAATRKHMSRFILRVLPVELTCYASEEEISRAIKPLIEQYFPAEAEPH
ncbi:hypothetical protein IFM89_006910, partial [Coptis chinensis]